MPKLLTSFNQLKVQLLDIIPSWVELFSDKSTLDKKARYIKVWEDEDSVFCIIAGKHGYGSNTKLCIMFGIADKCDDLDSMDSWDYINGDCDLCWEIGDFVNNTDDLDCAVDNLVTELEYVSKSYLEEVNA